PLRDVRVRPGAGHCAAHPRGAAVRGTGAGDLCRAIAVITLVSVLTGCSTLGRQVTTLPPAPAGPTPPPPSNIDSVPDAVPRREPRSAHGNPPFYDVMGKRYFVLGGAVGYVERGVASWYGPTFHGVNTSSGE